MTQKRKKQQTRTTPQVGIIFVVDDKVWVESTPLEEAGSYGEFKIHEGDHVVYWDRLVLEGRVPLGLEYENVPRGRVVFSTRTRRYRLMLDCCILRQKSLVATIQQDMGLLPKKPTPSRILTTAVQYVWFYAVCASAWELQT